MQFDFKECIERAHLATYKETVKRMEEVGASLEGNIDRGFIDGMINEIIMATTSATSKILEEYHHALMKYLAEKDSKHENSARGTE